MREARAVVIGAGIGGLSTAIGLASQGVAVTVLERAGAPGGKMREIDIGGQRIDAGPTVFTMRWVFEELFDAAGESFERAVPVRPVDVLARHAWNERDRLDLFVDLDRSMDAIGALAGKREAQGFRAFCQRAAQIYRALERTFIRAPRPNGPVGLATSFGLRGVRDLLRINPFETMWRALGDYFQDPRLRQLFGRYATYCGSSPFLAPATLMLVAHVECEGVWLVDGGMHRIARALADLATRKGVTIRYGSHVANILMRNGQACGVETTRGERFEADAVVANADPAALSAGAFGREASRAVPAIAVAERSLSAITWATVARTEGFPLDRHNVFFSADYVSEFDELVKHRRLPPDPTVYVCAQDRPDGVERPGTPERLFCLINSPADGDEVARNDEVIARSTQRCLERLRRCGLTVDYDASHAVVTTPADFGTLFPGTGGALYGAASHGWSASFKRPGARTAIPGLFLAGGSVHPGPGVPMAALSGRVAAAEVIDAIRRRN